MCNWRRSSDALAILLASSEALESELVLLRVGSTSWLPDVGETLRGRGSSSTVKHASGQSSCLLLLGSPRSSSSAHLICRRTKGRLKWERQTRSERVCCELTVGPERTGERENELAHFPSRYLALRLRLRNAQLSTGKTRRDVPSACHLCSLGPIRALAKLNPLSKPEEVRSGCRDKLDGREDNRGRAAKEAAALEVTLSRRAAFDRSL